MTLSWRAGALDEEDKQEEYKNVSRPAIAVMVPRHELYEPETW
ncbi:hypothetical protein AB73_3630 [Escherichia coli 3-020-07_S1_C3]|nr:hypothetical protein AB15_3663 [Escherichia coli 3-020-07_S1_C1]KDZ24269.1 hypothetical protein AB43_3683 [Escherichia coli 3-020-07_S1_C2]KDZ31020.1 hypothetical protein AB73_3630 [Escherichia coli 3-020-07_S1_C3]